MRVAAFFPGDALWTQPIAERFACLDFRVLGKFDQTGGTVVRMRRYHVCFLKRAEIVFNSFTLPYAKLQEKIQRCWNEPAPVYSKNDSVF